MGSSMAPTVTQGTLQTQENFQVQVELWLFRTDFVVSNRSHPCLEKREPVCLTPKPGDTDRHGYLIISEALIKALGSRFS